MKKRLLTLLLALALAVSLALPAAAAQTPVEVSSALELAQAMAEPVPARGRFRSRTAAAEPTRVVAFAPALADGYGADRVLHLAAWQEYVLELSDAAAAQRALVLPPAMAAALPAELAAQYGMTGAELDGAMAAVSPLLFPSVAAGAAPGQLERPALWAQGISGDLPVWCAQAERGVVRQWALLRALGVACDLALRSGDGGDYRQPTAGKVRGWLAALDLAHTLGAPGGVHLVPEEAFPALSLIHI